MSLWPAYATITAMKRRVAVRAIIIQDDRLLCVRLKAYQTAIANDFWCLPGGSVDEGEALLPALEREMLEETGVKPHIGALLYIQQFTLEAKDHLEFFFHVINTQDFQSIDLSKTSHGATEIKEIGFVDPAATHILPKFLTSEPLLHKIKTPGPTQIFVQN